MLYMLVRHFGHYLLKVFAGSYSSAAICIGFNKSTGSAITLAFCHTYLLVKIGSNQVTVSPALGKPKHTAKVGVIKFRVKHAAIIFITIILCALKRAIGIPVDAVFCSTQIASKAAQPVVCLVLADEIAFNAFLGCRQLRLYIDNTCYGIAAISERCCPFQHFYTLCTIIVYFYAVLIAPLLSFLPYAIVYHYHPVVA